MKITAIIQPFLRYMRLFEKGLRKYILFSDSSRLEAIFAQIPACSHLFRTGSDDVKLFVYQYLEPSQATKK